MRPDKALALRPFIHGLPCLEQSLFPAITCFRAAENTPEVRGEPVPRFMARATGFSQL